MNVIVNIVLIVAYAVLLAYCARCTLLVLTGTTRNYVEWSQGLGGFLYLAGVVLFHTGQSTELVWITSTVGIALVTLPEVLRWLAPRLYLRLTENC